MSSLEKKLYKQITVKSGHSRESLPAKKPTYKGFSTVNSNNSSSTLYDISLIKQDIINHFHIRKGEKLSDPTFGCIIWDLLFEPFTPAIQEAIIENVTTIVNYDSRIQADSIVVDTYEQGISIDCTVSYIPYNISEQIKFTFDQKNGLL